jgi:hypothetical protein
MMMIAKTVDQQNVTGTKHSDGMMKQSRVKGGKRQRNNSADNSPRRYLRPDIAIRKPAQPKMTNDRRFGKSGAFEQSCVNLYRHRANFKHLDFLFYKRWYGTGKSE